MKHRTVPALALLSLAALVLANCHNGDVIPPADATIDLAATPATIVTDVDASICLDALSLSKCGKSEIMATVSSAVGVPLEGQDVRFTSTAGKLYVGTFANVVANLPIRTDKYGNAHVSLITSATTTVNARSGKATGSLTLQTTSANIGSITLAQDETGLACAGGKASTAGEITSCSDEICLVATVVDDKGQGIPNLVLQFRLQNATGTNQFTGSFSPPQPSTSDPDGTAATVLKPSTSNCSTDCSNFKCDSVQVVAFTSGGVESAPLSFTIAIPQ